MKDLSRRAQRSQNTECAAVITSPISVCWPHSSGNFHGQVTEEQQLYSGSEGPVPPSVLWESWWPQEREAAAHISKEQKAQMGQGGRKTPNPTACPKRPSCPVPLAQVPQPPSQNSATIWRTKYSNTRIFEGHFLITGFICSHRLAVSSIDLKHSSDHTAMRMPLT